MRHTTAIALALLCGLTAAADAATIKFSTTLGPEAAGATGSGYAKVRWDTDLLKLDITTEFSGLTGTTTVAHIHCCTATPGAGTVGVALTPGTLPAFPVGVTGSFYQTSLDLSLPTTFTTTFTNNFGGGTVTGAQAALLQGLMDGQAYFNVHTTAFPGGEIRGFMVPEPVLLLLGAGLTGAVARHRLRR